ncbi:hypothetical protein EV175_004270 [Coemansia sp. RSA 1933]|nr:hypothetical protein EV175_004270 [Coemansia sp. RSA 1933]
MLTVQQIYTVPQKVVAIPQIEEEKPQQQEVSPISDPSTYKYAVFSADPGFNKTYQSKSKYSDDFMALRASLPVFQCCYAAYTLVFVHEMKRKSVVIFYTWTPADAPAEEKQRFIANGPSVARRLTHYDFHFQCTEWKEFQQTVAISKVCKLLSN